MSPAIVKNIFLPLTGKQKCVSFKLINVWVLAVTFTSRPFLCAKHSSWWRILENRRPNCHSILPADLSRSFLIRSPANPTTKKKTRVQNLTRGFCFGKGGRTGRRMEYERLWTTAVSQHLFQLETIMSFQKVYLTFVSLREDWVSYHAFRGRKKKKGKQQWKVLHLTGLCFTPDSFGHCVQKMRNKVKQCIILKQWTAESREPQALTVIYMNINKNISTMVKFARLDKIWGFVFCWLGKVRGSAFIS